MSNRSSTEWYKNQRRSRSIPIALNNLIVCCGEKTETQYFSRVCEIIKTKYPAQTGINFDIFVDAVDPLGMTDSIEKKYLTSIKAKHPYQHIWVVFDKDDFKNDNFDNAIGRLRALCEKYKENDVTFHALWSNECIELWFLLHFEYLTANISREQYFSKLTEYLKQNYKKNDKGLYARIMKAGGHLDFAMKNARKLNAAQSDKPESLRAPATNVVEFFEKYHQYLN